MRKIEKISGMNREALSTEHYFQSLLKEACNKQALPAGELEMIQMECLSLLAGKTEKYNRGSSSIPVEMAQGLLESIMFTIGAELKSCQSPDDALAVLQRDGAETICARGRKRIERMVEQAKLRHTVLMGRLIETRNVFCTSTIVDGIKGFFKLYEPEFLAQEIHITADYPVYNKAERLQGIEFIREYLEQLYYENQFCSYFSAEDIHHLLCGYNKHYQTLLLNLYRPTLAAALGCTIAGTDAGGLGLAPAVQAFLEHEFFGKGKAEIEGALAVALGELSCRFGFSEGLQAYVRQSLPLLAAEIKAAAENGTLGQVFITPQYPEGGPKLIVSYGEQMEDGLYRKALKEFMGCRSIEAKVRVIKRHIHSLADLNDLLSDAQLNGGEIAAILKELNPAEAAALLKKYKEVAETGFYELGDSEKALDRGLHMFLDSLPEDGRAELEKAVEILEVD